MNAASSRERGNAPDPSTGPAWTVRLATWSARHRASVIVAWFVLTIGLFAASQALGGIRAVNVTDPGERSLTESGRAAAAMSAGSAAAADERIDVVIAGQPATATDPAFRTAAEEVLDRLRGTTGVVDDAAIPAIAGLADPYAAAPTEGYIALDRDAVRLTGTIEGDRPAVAAKTGAVARTLASLRHELPGFEIHAISNTLLSDEMAEEINRDLDGALTLTLPATLLILVIAFGALVAACVPLVLAITALLGAFGIVGLFSRAVMPVSPYASQVIVLIGLAVAVDYSLFMISRFRSERRAGRDRDAAIEAASATAGRAVLFSGFAVMVSLGGLFLVPVAVFQAMAAGTIAVVLVSVLGSLVFLPAVLAVVGDGVNRGTVGMLARRRGGEGAWPRLVGAVMRHPIAAALAVTTVLLAIASPALRLRLGEPDVTALPGTLDGVQAVEQLREHWPQGTLGTLDAVVTGGNPAARLATVERLSSALPAVPGLSGPARVIASGDGSATSLSLVMSGASNDAGNWQTVRDVRSGLAASAAAEPPGVAVLVGGTAATSMDQTSLFADGMARIVVFVLALSFLLLLLVFHSIAIPLKAIAMNLLATGAAFGALVLVFQDGWFAAPLGIRPTEITHFVPIFVFTTLFGLSMDYEVFILARIKEAHDRGVAAREAVASGIALTAGTVTSAAAIMVVVFAVFLTLPLAIARQMGLGLALAVLVDATLITVLLPATMRLLGEWNWWLPPFLRRLPTIHIDGEPAPKPFPGAAGLAAPAAATVPVRADAAVPRGEASR